MGAVGKLLARGSSWLDRITAARGRGLLIPASLALAILAALALAHRLAPPRGLAASYWTNPSWEGSPALRRIDPEVRFDKAAIARRLASADTFSVRWEGFLHVPASATYLFTITSDDGSQVFLDGSLAVDNGGRHAAETKRGRVPLSAGSHRIAITYFEAGGLGVVDFSWRAEGALARFLPALPVFPDEVAAGRHRLDRLLTYLTAILLAALALTALMLLATLLRALLPGQGPLEALAACAFVVLLAFNAREVLLKRSTAVTACDTYAYFQAAEEMSHRGWLEARIQEPLVPAIYRDYAHPPSKDQVMFLLSPHGHYVHDLERGVIHNVFPPGLPWLLLPFLSLGGPGLAFLVLPLLHIAAAIVFFIAATRFVGVLFAVPATAFTFFNFTIFEQTVNLMSDLPSMVLLTASCCCLFLARRSPRPLLVVAAGVLFGLSLPLRYSNAVAAIPLLLLLLARPAGQRGLKQVAGDLARFSAAALLCGVLPLALYTHHLFGTPLRLVYEPSTQSRVALANVPGDIFFYALGLLRLFGGPGLLLIGVGLVAGLLRRRWRLAASVGAVAVLAFLAFYLPQSMREHRYLMPIYPVLAMFYAFAGLLLGELLRRWRLVAVAVAVLLAAYPLARSHARYYQADFSQPQTCQSLAQKVEPNAVIFADLLSGPVRLYAGLTGYRFIWTRLEVLQETLRILHRLSRPVYFLLDSPTAVEHFKFMLDHKAVTPEQVQLVTTINGLPLYRFTPSS